MKIDQDLWRLKAASIEEKKELFDYATAKGIALEEDRRDVLEDDDLWIQWFLGSLWTEPECFPSEDPYEVITAAEFRAMCDEYATANGVAA